MKLINTFLLAMLVFAGCIKPPEELTPSFWDPETEVAGLAEVIDSSYQLNNANQRYYNVRFSIDWDLIPEAQKNNVISVAVYNNGVSIPMQSNTPNKIEYQLYFFASPAYTTCITIGFLTSNGGFTRQFDFFCVDVP